MKNAILILFSLLIYSGCKKKTVTSPEEAPAPAAPVVHGPSYDTSKPGSYFPVWPGSWWTYADKTGTQVTDSASKTWVLHSYRFGYLENDVTDSVFVPLYHGNPIYRYDRLNYKSKGMKMYNPYAFLAEQIGPLGSSFLEDGSITISEALRVVSKSANSGGDSLITVWGSFYISPYVPPPMIDQRCKSIRIYQKNVGLIFHCKYDTITSDTLIKRTLVQHYIAPH